MFYVGFSGTRFGLNEHSLKALSDLINKLPPLVTGRHGLCKGADEQFHDLMTQRQHPIIGHPGPVSEYSCDLACDVMLPNKPHLKRNADIVNSSWVMITCPPTIIPQDRGGTWWTIKYALKASKPTAIISPGGTVEYVNGFLEAIE